MGVTEEIRYSLFSCDCVQACLLSYFGLCKFIKLKPRIGLCLIVNSASSNMSPAVLKPKTAVELPSTSTYATEDAKERKHVSLFGESPGYMFVRLAGLCGALAVAFAAYDTHGR